MSGHLEADLSKAPERPAAHTRGAVTMGGSGMGPPKPGNGDIRGAMAATAAAAAPASEEPSLSSSSSSAQEAGAGEQDAASESTAVMRSPKSKRMSTVVIKLGTSSIVDETTYEPLLDNLNAIVETVVHLRRAGFKVVLVSSGAMGVGLHRMRYKKKPKHLSQLQAIASIGQCRLIGLWDSLFSQHGQAIGQILLTRNDVADRTQYQNAQNTFTQLLEDGVVPIVNENDTIAVTEIKFGDNDTLSAITAAMVHADYLFLMTDVDCLYDRNPRAFPDAKPIEVVEDISKLNVDVSSSGSKLGTGGMSTKIVAARLASSAGVMTVIMRASQPENIVHILRHAQSLRPTTNHSSSNSVSSTPSWNTLSRRNTNPNMLAMAAELGQSNHNSQNVSGEGDAAPSTSLLAAHLQQKLASGTPVNSTSETSLRSSVSSTDSSSLYSSFATPALSSSETWNPMNLNLSTSRTTLNFTRDSTVIPKHTRFIPAPRATRDRYVWILWGLATHGTIYIDAGAHRALKKSAGLLPVGVVDVEGNFAQQEAVRIVVVDKHTWRRQQGGVSQKVGSSESALSGAHLSQQSGEKRDGASSEARNGPRIDHSHEEEHAQEARKGSRTIDTRSHGDMQKGIPHSSLEPKKIIDHSEDSSNNPTTTHESSNCADGNHQRDQQMSSVPVPAPEPSTSEVVNGNASDTAIRETPLSDESPTIRINDMTPTSNLPDPRPEAISRHREPTIASDSTTTAHNTMPTPAAPSQAATNPTSSPTSSKPSTFTTLATSSCTTTTPTTTSPTTTTGIEVGRAIVNYSALEIARIRGRQTSEIRGILGYAETEYIALRENLSLFDGDGAGGGSG